MSQDLKLETRIGMRLSQQQLRFVKLLELNAPELDETVERELEDNPALSASDQNSESNKELYPIFYNSNNQDDTPQFTPVDESESLYDYLNRQLAERNLDPKLIDAAQYIIGNLDSNGYLHRSLENLIDDLAFGPGIEITIQDGENLLKTIQSLDPPGIAASDLQECLILQLRAMPTSTEQQDAIRIIEEAYDLFTMKHKNKIPGLLRISDKRVDAALALILSLNPKPGASLGNNPSDHSNIIIPDYIISNDDGELTISLNNKIPELQIEQSFKQAVEQMNITAKNRKEKKGSEFIISRYNDARDFIRILSQRQQTMMAVMTAIVKIQKEYFETEDVYKLKPMMIKNVAELTGYDLSVISRATANKFVATPWGIFPLRFFFSDSIGETDENGEAATNRKIEAEITFLVENEDKKKPLSDQKLTELMISKGFDISRRTVTKYRERCGIPVARLRKNL